MDVEMAGNQVGKIVGKVTLTIGGLISKRNAMLVQTLKNVLNPCLLIRTTSKRTIRETMTCMVLPKGCS